MAKVDFFIEFLGSNEFNGANLTAAKRGDFPGWDAANTFHNAGRTLVTGECGSKPSGQGEIEPVRDAVIKAMEAQAGGSRANIGGVALLGSSNGCAVALSVAVALNRRLTYISLMDLPMFPFGRTPPVPGIGDLTPANAPQTSNGMGASGWLPGSAGVTRLFKIKPLANDTPTLAPPHIDARIKKNFYQVDGNWTKVKGYTTQWIWTSDMMGGEVHGTLAGDNWTNVLVDASGATVQDDDGFHGQPQGLEAGVERVKMMHELTKFDP